MAIELFNSAGVLTLDRIDDAEVALLDQPRQDALHVLIGAVLAKTKSDQRYAAARDTLRAALISEEAAKAAFELVNPVPTFLETRAAAIAAFNGVKPAPPVIDSNTKTGSHKKFAVATPKKDWIASITHVQECQIEYRDALEAQRSAIRAEGKALADWLALNRPPDQMQVFREWAARGNAERAAAVARGDDPDAKSIPVIDRRSKIDIAAINRPRARAGSGTPTPPLRSAVVRR